jgi:GGDEF domain-containing protein
MTNLKRSFAGAAAYLALIFVLGQADYSGAPIINFANYFYVAVLTALPLTLFFPSVSRVPAYVPLGVWAGVYIVLLLTLNRRLSTNSSDISVIALEFIFLETGVWYAYHLAKQLSHAESIMDTLALNAFPNRARDIESGYEHVKVELTRSRRYNRPLSIVLIESESDDRKSAQEKLMGIQHDLMNRFTSARVAQIIDDSIRQTDLVLKGYRGSFIVLCPETDRGNAVLLAKRISREIKERIGLQVLLGYAAFPEDALTFEDLMRKARDHLAYVEHIPSEAIAIES